MIDTEKDNRKLVERALLVGAQDHLTSLTEARDHLAELSDLVDSMGVGVIGSELVTLREPHPKYFIGSGKAEEITEELKRLEADCLVFDFELSPSQQRNWEQLTKLCVIDRQEVILDIFASRASTKEAVLQVELARMQYALPRLTRAWSHLSRQRGGAKGTRGEGEQQIEVDRRIVQKKIATYQKELKEVRKHRETQRKNRGKNLIPQAAIVGYTNAGKSSLLNALTGAGVLVEDKLFATLDPTTRKVTLPNKQDLLLTDTVGFIRKLPHALVEAFKATLEEAVLADFLIHVVDVTSPQIEENWNTTLSVLEELGAHDKPMITVFNKVDLDVNPVMRVRLKNIYPGCVFVSAHTKEGFEELSNLLINMATGALEIINLRIPPHRHDIIAMAYEKGNVLHIDYDPEGHALLRISVDSARKPIFAEFAHKFSGDSERVPALSA